jgi:hypothetical protein
MGETRVDLLHLLQDLADAYPGDLHETILTEIIANALDSGATRVRLVTDVTTPALTVIDDGRGMRRADLRRFHDLGASTKTRGQGIGFAGVGIKLGLLVSDEVVTESRRGQEHVSTTWMLSNRRRAPWRWIPPSGMVNERGTAVRLRLSSALSPLLDSGFLEAGVRRHFEPLLDPSFDDLLRKHYPSGVRFEINELVLARAGASERAVAPIAVRLAGKRKPSAIGYLVRGDEQIDEDRRGVAISTFGKVIKRGWDWLGMMPALADRVSGSIEAPELAASLTLNKGDFLRSGPRGASFLAYRKAMQEAVSAQLAQWGDAEHGDQPQQRRVARPIERDMESVLAGLADEFPLIAMLVKRAPGGPHKLRVGRARTAEPDQATIDMFAAPAVEPEALLPEVPTAESPPAEAEHVPPAEPASPISAERPPAEVGLPAHNGRRQPTRLGLHISFESRADDPELARLVDTTIWVNDAHPAYRRAAASRAEGYHVALAVALALGKVAVDPAREREFVLEFLARWGEARDGTGRRKTRRGERRSKR